MRDGGLGFGLIGASTISREWMIGAMRESGVAEPVAIMSRDMARAGAFAAANGIPRAYSSLGAMLADPAVEAVYIASTNDRHHPEVLECAAAGKHVLCDKPLALSVEQGLEMVRACADAGVVLAVNHHLRNAATHRALRDCIAAGEVGRIVTARVSTGAVLPPHLQTWRINDPASGAGVVLDLTVHDADVLHFLLDDRIAEVAAVTANSGMAAPAIEDTALTVGRTERGVLVQMHDVFNAPFHRGSVEIHGTHGSLVALGCMTQAPGGSVTLRNAHGDWHLPLRHENLYARGIRRFVAATRGEDGVPCSGLEGVRSLAVALAVLESARTGRTVKVATW